MCVLIAQKEREPGTEATAVCLYTRPYDNVVCLYLQVDKQQEQIRQLERRLKQSVSEQEHLGEHNTLLTTEIDKYGTSNCANQGILKLYIHCRCPNPYISPYIVGQLRTPWDIPNCNIL